jgi:uncharacterized repeat protein (TIGR02543 family)
MPAVYINYYDIIGYTSINLFGNVISIPIYDFLSQVKVAEDNMGWQWWWTSNYWEYKGTLSGNYNSGYSNQWKFRGQHQSGTTEDTSVRMYYWDGSFPSNYNVFDPGSEVRLHGWKAETWLFNFVLINKTANTYTATFVYNNGANNGTANYIYNNAFTLGTPTRTGYTFSKWTSNPNIGEGTSFTWTNAGNITFSAQWTAHTYTIRYNANSGNDIVTGSTSNTSAVYNNGLTIRSNGFTRTGFYFDGWATTANGGVSQDYIVGSTINHPGSNSTLDLYAVWIALYNITFNNSGRGESISTVLSGKSGTVITVFPILSNMLGYIFSGWMINSVLITSVTLTGNVILYAKWDVDERVSFSYIQEIFGGNYPISLSEYYSNNGYVNRPRQVNER